MGASSPVVTEVVVDPLPHPLLVQAGAAVGGGAQTEEKTSCDAGAAKGSVHVGESSGPAKVIWPALTKGSRTLMLMGGNPNQWGGPRLT
jgi:hypothetical protein